MNGETEEVIARMKGKKFPPACPSCGKRMYQIYSAEPLLEWDEERGEYLQTHYFREEPQLCCSNCNIRLPDALAREILEKV